VKLQSSKKVPGKKKNTRIRWLLTVGLFIGISIVIRSNLESFYQLSEFDLRYLFPLAIVISLKFASNAKMQSDLLKERGIYMNWKEWYSLGVSAALYNQFLPAKGGTILRSIYLKKEHGLDFSAFLLLNLQKTLYLIVCIGLWGSLIVWLFLYDSIYDKFRYSLIFTAISLLAMCVIYSPSVISKTLSRFRSLLIDVDLKVRLKVFFQLAISALLLVVFSGLEFYVGYLALDIPIRIADCLITGAIIILVAQVPITPGNLGVREGAMGAVMYILGYSLPDALVVSLLIRTVMLIDTVVIGVFADAYLARLSRV
jgi:uncharacterized membrane protein YbhN (UPF0104 family)